MQSDISWRWWAEIDPGKKHIRNLSHSSWPLGNLKEGIYNIFVLFYWQRHRNMLYLVTCPTVSHYFIALWFILASKYLRLKYLNKIFPQNNSHSTSNSFSHRQVLWPGHVCSGITLVVAVISGEHQCDLWKCCFWGITNPVLPAAPIPAHLGSFVVPVAPGHHLNVVWHISPAGTGGAQFQLLLWLHHFIFWVLSQLLCHTVGYDKALHVFLYLVWAMNFGM